MSILQRALKYALATCLAAWVAMMVGLVNPMTAGVIALLSVSDTRRTTARLALERFVSICVAMGLAWVLMSLFGFQLWVLGAFLLLYVPIVYRLRVSVGIVASTVLITQIMGWQSLTLREMTNQFGLFFIGVSVALLLNLYMPSKLGEIQRYQQQIEAQLRALLLLFSADLRRESPTAQQEIKRQIQQLFDALDQALQLVLQESDNQLFAQTNYYVHYVEMRQAQAHLLEQMIVSVDACLLESEEGKLLAGIFYLTANQLDETNPAVYLLEDIEQLKTSYRERPLPSSRQEFETRAVLFQLLNDFTRFIQLKVDFHYTYASTWQKE